MKRKTRNMKHFLSISFGLLFLLGISGNVFAYTSPGKPTGFVNDYAQLLSNEKRAALESDLEQFEKQTSHEISVVTIKSLQGDAIEDYANTLFREWGIGKKDANNGVLFLVAVDDRKMRIEVGYGLEGALTDIESKHIQDDYVRPLFKEGKYEEGIILGTQKIKGALQGELVAPQQKESKIKIGSGGFELIIFLLFIFFQWFVSILGRSKSWWLGGVVGVILGALIGFFTSWWILIIILGPLGLLFDYVVSKNYQKNQNNPPWWMGGGGFGSGGGFGGGGFGGFGGGSSGGGGSSSGW